MKKIYFIFILAILSFPLHSQFNLKFGDVKADDITNKPYPGDPGADALILSDIATCHMNYRDGFYVRLERNMKIRIINSDGFSHADIEIPFSSENKLIAYKASSYNLRNGEKIETPIPKKSFITEQTTKYKKTLKFNFPDVHEGTVIEYSYIMEMKDESLGYLIPWQFQRNLPVKYTSLIVSYPEFFIYKTNISGNPNYVQVSSNTSDLYIGGEKFRAMTYEWYAGDIPSYRSEPYMKNIVDNQTRLTFELASVNFPNSSREEITPTYETLSKKLLERDDFGIALKKGMALKKTSEEITAGLKSEADKAKAIHRHVSGKILWDGTNDWTASVGLMKAYKKQRGNSADVNMLLITMLRYAGLKADPVILSTRSNGSINKLSAMVRQFDYLVADVTIDGESVLMDATDPLRPYNMLPFECLNESGRLINNYDSRFVDLRNDEKMYNHLILDLRIQDDGTVSGKMKRTNEGFDAYAIRKIVYNAGREGYNELLELLFSNAMIGELELLNLSEPDSNLIETCTLQLDNAVQRVGSNLLINPFFCFSESKNPFISPERRSPVDFGCPKKESHSIKIQLPAGYKVAEKIPDAHYTLGKGDADYYFSFNEENGTIVIESSISINKTSFTVAEYKALRDFYAKILQSQARLAVLQKS